MFLVATLVPTSSFTSPSHQQTSLSLLHSSYSTRGLMGSNEGDENGEKKRFKRAYLAVSLLCFVISVAGGFVLGWWLYKYHPTNKQLWMVPFGFVLFLTPIICCLFLILPDFCTSKTDPEDAAASLNDPIPKRLS